MAAFRPALLVLGLLAFGGVRADQPIAPNFVRILPADVKWKDDPDMPGVRPRRCTATPTSTASMWSARASHRM